MPVPVDTVVVKLYRGWNLVSVPGKLLDIASVQNNDKKLVAYLYLKDEKKYVTLGEAQKVLGDDFEDYLAQNAFWVYAYENNALTLKVDYRDSSKINLGEGWNFVPIRNEWVLSSLAQLDTNCEFARMYGWDPREQQWVSSDKNHQFQEWEANRGFLAKVSGECSISTSSVVMLPPPIPE